MPEAPRTRVFRIDQLNAIGPWRDIDAAALTELEQHGTGLVEQRKNSQPALDGVDVEIGHAASVQRVSVAQVVMDVETGHLSGQTCARPVHADELGNDIAQRLGAIVRTAKRD